MESLEKWGDRIIPIQGNVGNPDDRNRIIEQTVLKFGSLDMLINNAAANPVFGPIEEADSTAFGKIMQVNVEAALELGKLALPYFQRSGKGQIVNISSIGGLHPEPGLGIYSISKAALNSLTQVLAREWGQHGVRVNAICPGLVKTDFSTALWSNEKALASVQRRTPLGDIAEPEHIAKAVLGLLAGAEMITGQILTVDGGFSI